MAKKTQAAFIGWFCPLLDAPRGIWATQDDREKCLHGLRGTSGSVANYWIKHAGAGAHKSHSQIT
jgi:hypothetical protein